MPRKLLCVTGNLWRFVTTKLLYRYHSSGLL